MAYAIKKAGIVVGTVTLGAAGTLNYYTKDAKLATALNFLAAGIPMLGAVSSSEGKLADGIDRAPYNSATLVETLNDLLPSPFMATVI